MFLHERVGLIYSLFEDMDGMNASSYQIRKVARFRAEHPELREDLNFCFEVLAGRHKLGYKLYYLDNSTSSAWVSLIDNTIAEFYNKLKQFSSSGCDTIKAILTCSKAGYFEFWYKLVNLEYKLGYSNKANMVTDKHCMLAKSYPKDFRREQYYYIQEKLNGNRCIAYYEDDMWKFMSRSQKPLVVDFDMSDFDTALIYDGEIMTRNKMGNKDFASTSGIVNSKYGNKSNLMYYIYDILDSTLPYSSRLDILLSYMITSENVRVLKVLDKIWVYPNPAYNGVLDEWLDKIVAKGGEGVMLRDPDAPYYHSKHSGDRRDVLIKYKKTKTCDLRIVGYNEGKGKYIGMIGSFICQSDDGKVEVNVAGMVDDVRAMDYADAHGRIIEVTYFDSSRGKNKDTMSLQFPRMTKWRNDKDETSMY